MYCRSGGGGGLLRLDRWVTGYGGVRGTRASREDEMGEWSGDMAGGGKATEVYRVDESGDGYET